MKRFEFRLNRVLELRRIEAEMEMNKLAQMESEMEKLQDRLRQLADAYQHQVAIVGTDPGERLALGENRVFSDTERRKVEFRVRDQQGALDQQRRVYVLAKQKCEVLEKVKNKQKGVWNRAFQKEIDDLALDSYLARWQPPEAERPS